MNTTNNTQNTSPKDTKEENITIQPVLVKDKQPQLVTLTAVDWNAKRLWQRVHSGQYGPLFKE